MATVVGLATIGARVARSIDEGLSIDAREEDSCGRRRERAEKALLEVDGLDLSECSMAMIVQRTFSFESNSVNSTARGAYIASRAYWL